MCSQTERPSSPSGNSGTDDWFRRVFDAFYLELYRRRDDGEAEVLVEAIARAGRRGPALEIACGAGRFLEALVRRGETVVGLDLSPELLDRALRRLGPPSRLVRGDMRRLPFRSASFPLVLILFTSFGYFADAEEDRETLREAGRVLAPEGSVLLDFLNAPRSVARLVPQSERMVQGLPVREDRWVDPAGPFLRKRTTVGDGGTNVREERVRLYAPAELAALAGSVGLHPVDSWGDYAGNPFSPEESERFLLWLRKERT